MVEMGQLTEAPDVAGLLDNAYFKEAMKRVL
jgi:hypothetical protein